jgi:putative phage-type endonuclease
VLTEAQLLARKGGIGSSDIAAILGEDPFKGPIAVWLSKVESIPDEPSDQAAWGHEVEDLIARRWAAKRGDVVSMVKGDTVSHRDHPWCMATPDRIVTLADGGSVLAEAKNVGHRMLGRWRVASDVEGDIYRAPSYVVLQGQWQMLVTGHRRCYVVALLGGRDFHEEAVDADPELQEAMFRAALAFWNDYVERGVMPPPDGTKVARRLLSQLYPEASSAIVQGTPEHARIAREYADARRAETEAKKAKEKAGDLLRGCIADAERVVGSWGYASWVNTRGKVSWEKVAKAAGATAEQIEAARGEPSRTLNVKIVGGEDE